jgi:hypothetical protein
MLPRIYTDTSVIGGCLDFEFRDSSTKLIQSFISGAAIMVLSDLTQIELNNAPESVIAVLNQISEEFVEYVELTEEASNLAASYIQKGVIGETKWVDAQHIAIATIARVDVLVS